MTAPLTVLIVDDNADDRESYLRLLKKGDASAFRCREVGEGNAALEAVAATAPDCVLLDYSLPGENGLDVMRRIKTLHPRTPVIMLTAYGSEDVAAKAIKYGADEYIAKGTITAESLRHAIGIAIEHNRLRHRIDEQTEQHERQTRQLMEKLIRSNAELERFAYVASHDMQEPLRMLVKLSRMLIEDEEVAGRARDNLGLIGEAAERLQAMVEDLLDFARLEGQARNPQPIDAGAEIAHALQNLDALIQESGAQISCGAMPRLTGNPVQFMRLMQNLVGNAIKYRQPGVAPKISIAAEDIGSAWRVSVGDNGIGVDAKNLERVFEPFYRLNSSGRTSGTGLGLSVCKRIVESHGGQIWMTSAPGRGSTVYVTLPKSAAEKRLVA